MIVTFFVPATLMASGELATEIDIIPSPKVMELTGKRFVLSHNGAPRATIIINKDDQKAALAAAEINERIKTMGGQPLPIDSHIVNVDADMNTILLSLPAKAQSDDLPRDVWEARNALASKDEQGYLIRFFQGHDERRVALLSGSGWLGLLYASSTLRLLIKKDGATIYATEAQITDWPDFKNRGLPVWPLPGSYTEFKKYIDWAFQYKFNRIYTYTTRKRVADGFNLPTPEERLYLKKINNYAKERGIIINYALNWAVATAALDGKKGDYQGTVLFNGHYYTWSDNTLLRRRAAEIAQFAKEIDAGSLHLHCIDTYEESWDKRGIKDRERFGNNRAAADANVINIFTEEIRKINPGIELQFVAYPYHINFDLKGNEQYKIWMKRLADLISNDTYLVVTDFNRDQTDSWVNTIKQPLVHWINGNAFQWGRYFSTYPAFTKSSYYSGRDRDIIINFEPIGYFNGEVMQLFASEYAWNTEATGSGYVREDSTGALNVTAANLHYRKELIDGRDVNVSAWFNGTSEPKKVTDRELLNACRLEFGEAAAPYMADYFRNNPVGWRSATLYGQVLNDIMAGNELEASLDQLKKVEKALSNLKEAIDTVKMDNPVRDRLNNFIKNTYRQYLIIVGTTAYYQAKHLLTKGLNKEAADVIKDSTRKLTELRREMEIKGYWSDESQNWFEEGYSKLILAESGVRKHLSINLIGNPGFEDPLSSVGHDKKAIHRWSSSAGSLKLTTDSHNGRYAGKLTLKPTERYIILEQQFKIAPGCKCYVEFWLKKSGGCRVIPIIQYWNAEQAQKIEALAITDFPSTADVSQYMLYSGSFAFPLHAKQAVFKIYMDWYGTTPIQARHVYIDDVIASCLSTN